MTLSLIHAGDVKCLLLLCVMGPAVHSCPFLELFGLLTAFACNAAQEGACTATVPAPDATPVCCHAAVQGNG
jgi:hypothetical protein